MEKAHEVARVLFSGTRMLLTVDGRDYEIDVARHSRKLGKLADASPAERERLVVSPCGYGIHWPDLDEDLSIDGLIGVKRGRAVAGTPEE